MTARQLPRISGIDPKVAKILEPMKEALQELIGDGQNRAARVSDFGNGFRFSARGDVIEFDPGSFEAVRPEIERRIEQLVAAQTDISTLAEEILGTAKFGSLLGATMSDVKSLTVNVNNHVAGFGVAVYGGAAGPVTSDFIIQADRFAVVFPSPAWQPTFAYALGQYVSATPMSGVGNILFEVTTAGTTGATEPTWNTTPGQTTSSGSVVFTARSIDERVPFVVGLVGGQPTVGINGTLLVDGTIFASSIATPLVLTHQIVIDPTGYIRSGQTAYNTGVGWFWGNNAGTPVFSIGNPAANRVTWDGTTLTVVGNVSGALQASSLVGTLPASVIDLAAWGWTANNTFSATDADTVAWSSGTFTAANGASYSIASGNTGNMSARTYIYLDINVSTTAYQTTTNPATPVGAGKVLIAVAQNGTDTPFFQVFGGNGGINGVSFASMEGDVNLSTQVSGTLTVAFAAAGLINSNVTINADGTLTGAGGGQVSLNSLPGDITSTQIEDNAITTGKINANAVTAAKIAANTITAAEIAALTITAAQIAANTITAAKIAALTITAAEIAASTITAAKIAANTITANEIAANTITTNQIAASTITAGNIAASFVWAKDFEITTDGKIRQGKTSASSTTAGFWLGYDGSASYDFHIGDATSYFWWDGSVATLKFRGNLDFSAQAFTPNWDTGFSSAPSGDLSYIDFGSFVMLWAASALLGTGNANAFSIDNLPSAIRPSGVRHMTCVVDFAGVTHLGQVRLGQNPAGSVSWQPADIIAATGSWPSTATARVRAAGIGATGTNGLPAGWMVIYPK